METRTLPFWRSHKRVQAVRVLSVEPYPDGGGLLTVEPPHGPIAVGQHYMRKHEPKAGGYYVLYEDGYESWSPAPAFEKGYKRI